MDRYSQLKDMSLDGLVDVVNRYPWFGLARKFLCVRMQESGGNGWGMPGYSEAAMYVPTRSRIFALLRSEGMYSDKDVDGIIRRMLGKSVDKEQSMNSHEGKNKGFRGVGDYFSQEQYASVRGKEGGDFRNLSSSDDTDVPVIEMIPDFGLDFCTETLAGIYAEQGYYQQAKEIYSKLILAYPEKNAYFAALIEKMDAEIKN